MSSAARRCARNSRAARRRTARARRSVRWSAGRRRPCHRRWCSCRRRDRARPAPDAGGCRRGPTPSARPAARPRPEPAPELRRRGRRRPP
uniref:Uncharacterized protein n=1 Tax=Parastrongyloides trichosuri TaxID=131310 RepID=A0A0N4ZZW1_PARTI